jgi:hypothetical protein
VTLSLVCPVALLRPLLSPAVGQRRSSSFRAAVCSWRFTPALRLHCSGFPASYIDFLQGGGSAEAAGTGRTPFLQVPAKFLQADLAALEKLMVQAPLCPRCPAGEPCRETGMHLHREQLGQVERQQAALVWAGCTGAVSVGWSQALTRTLRVLERGWRPLWLLLLLS